MHFFNYSRLIREVLLLFIRFIAMAEAAPSALCVLNAYSIKKSKIYVENTQHKNMFEHMWFMLHSLILGKFLIVLRSYMSCQFSLILKHEAFKMDVVSHTQQLFNFEPQNSFREMREKINIVMFL